MELFVEQRLRLAAFDADATAVADLEDMASEDEADAGATAAELVYARRLAAGLHGLQLLATALATVAIHSPAARARVQAKLREKGCSAAAVHAVLVGYAGALQRAADLSAGKDGEDGEIVDGPRSNSANEQQLADMVARIAVSFPVE